MKRYLLQAVNYSVFMVVVWYFSAAPALEVLPPDKAILTIVFRHAGELREPCRELTSEELSALAKNMQVSTDCQRARSPITIQASLNNEELMNRTLHPPGLFDDGGVDVYHSLRVTSGRHELEVHMSDSVQNPGFRHKFREAVDFSPGQVVLLRFEPEGGFFIPN